MTVTLGNLILRNSGYAALAAQRVAVLANPTAVFADTLEHLVDAMHRDLTSANASLLTVLSPEHGFRGDHQAEHGDRQYVDPSTGLPVWPAYSLPVANITAVLHDLKVGRVVVDMQDAGVRLYTFIWTMYKVMAAASAMGARLVVLDRPNPLGGDDGAVAGPQLNMSCCASGYGMAPITHQHGLTIGELATLFAEQLNTSVDVVKMQGWHRAMRWRDTGLNWIPPSPNLPFPASANAYPATVFLEATTAAEGRGTTTPFTLFGAPWLSAYALAQRLNTGANSSAALFRASWFTPVPAAHDACLASHAISLTAPTTPTSGDSPLRAFFVRAHQPLLLPPCHRAGLVKVQWHRLSGRVLGAGRWRGRLRSRRSHRERCSRAGARR